MPTLQEYLDASVAEILEEARAYSLTYQVPLAEALRDVRDDYVQAWKNRNHGQDESIN